MAFVDLEDVAGVANPVIEAVHVVEEPDETGHRGVAQILKLEAPV